MTEYLIQSKADLLAQVRRLGILPYFSNRVPGWSVEAHIDPALWFTDREGPWEWKGPLAYEKVCVYGKLIRGKAAFVSPECFAHLANYRRDGLTLEERTDAALVSHREGLLYAYVAAHPGELSKNARRECGFAKGYDGVLTRLQMQTYVIDQDFCYSIDRHGHPYGWGNAALITPEAWLGEGFMAAADCVPEASLEYLIERLCREMPGVDEAALRRELA